MPNPEEDGDFVDTFAIVLILFAFLLEPKNILRSIFYIQKKYSCESCAGCNRHRDEDLAIDEPALRMFIISLLSERVAQKENENVRIGDRNLAESYANKYRENLFRYAGSCKLTEDGLSRYFDTERWGFDYGNYDKVRLIVTPPTPTKILWALSALRAEIVISSHRSNLKYVALSAAWDIGVCPNCIISSTISGRMDEIIEFLIQYKIPSTGIESVLALASKEQKMNYVFGLNTIAGDED